MNLRCCSGILLATLAAGTVCGGEIINEDFEGAAFDPAFNHSIAGSWGFGSEGGGTVLWLYPATDTITFNLLPGEVVEWAQVTFTDYCSVGCTWVEFNGTEGSALIANSSVGGTETHDTAGLGLGTLTSIELHSSEGWFDNVMIEIADECSADLDGDGDVGFGDLLLVLGAWGTNGPGATLAAPFNTVDFADLLVVLTQWGPCP